MSNVIGIRGWLLVLPKSLKKILLTWFRVDISDSSQQDFISSVLFPIIAALRD
jgi:hypothetical protein